MVICVTPATEFRRLWRLDHRRPKAFGRHIANECQAAMRRAQPPSLSALPLLLDGAGSAHVALAVDRARS
jgi:hypothetical protein